MQPQILNKGETEKMVKKVLKINMPYTEESLFVDIDNENRPLIDILKEVEIELEKDGRFYESQQLKAYISDPNCIIRDSSRSNNNSTPISDAENGRNRNMELQKEELKIQFKLKHEQNGK